MNRQAKIAMTFRTEDKVTYTLSCYPIMGYGKGNGTPTVKRFLRDWGGISKKRGLKNIYRLGRDILGEHIVREDKIREDKI